MQSNKTSRWALRLLSLLATALVAASCGGGGGGNSEPGWYYHFICNGDSQCLQLNFLPNGTASGTSSQGPGVGGQSGCNSLMNFGSRNWNVPPAQQWCDNTASIGTPPGGGGATPATISAITPTSGEAGTAVTITGTGFPISGAGITVNVGAVAALISSVSNTRLVISIPPLAGGSYAVSVVISGTTVTAAQSLTVVVPIPLGNATIKKMAAGADHACAILVDDTVKCWGSNTFGELGSGSTAATTAAVAVAGIANAIDIAAGASFSCAVVAATAGATTGAVKCWGKGDLGQLGHNALTNASSPVAAGSLSTATQVSARAGHACALLASGQVMCWGSGGSGQLGNGATANSAVPVAVLGTGADNYDLVNQFGEPASTKAFQVSTGNAHTCARVSTSRGSLGLGVKCWGETNRGELGNGATFCQANTICDPKGPNPSPQRVSNLSNAYHLAAGGGHTCVVVTNGATVCWGQGSRGQLGNGAMLHANVPVSVLGPRGADIVASSGSEFSCVSANRALKCWGRNDGGQLGNGTTTDASSPVTVTAIGLGAYEPETLTGGSQRTCMKRTDGTAFCFP